jgi:hypothetical protein
MCCGVDAEDFSDTVGTDDDCGLGIDADTEDVLSIIAVRIRVTCGSRCFATFAYFSEHDRKPRDAAALGEVRVEEDAGDEAEEAVGQCQFFVASIRERFGCREGALVADVRPDAEHGAAGAGASDDATLLEDRADRTFERAATPAKDVARLIATTHEDRVGRGDLRDDRGVVRVHIVGRVKILGFCSGGEELGAATTSLCQKLSDAAGAAGCAFSAASLGGMFGVYFSATLPTNYAEVMQSDRERFNRFFHGMLSKGVYLAPSAFEAGFVSKAHTAADIDETVRRAAEVFATLK